MAKYYGYFHSLTEFIGKLVPKRGFGSAGIEYFHEVVEGIKRLDAVQERNPFVTLSVSAGGGIWVSYQGLRNFMILPGQGSLRVLTGMWEGDLAQVLDREVSRGRALNTTGENDYRQWKVPTAGLEAIWRFVEKLKAPREAANQIADPSHPRFFPGPVRQAALEQFDREGRLCRGAKGRKAHKVGKSARIEFDHILPYASKGPSTAQNLQILCQECNRLKSGSAL